MISTLQLKCRDCQTVQKGRNYMLSVRNELYIQTYKEVKNKEREKCRPINRLVLMKGKLQG